RIRAEVSARLSGDRLNRGGRVPDHLPRLVPGTHRAHPLQGALGPQLRSGLRVHLAALLRRCLQRPGVQLVRSLHPERLQPHPHAQRPPAPPAPLPTIPAGARPPPPPCTPPPRPPAPPQPCPGSPPPPPPPARSAPEALPEALSPAASRPEVGRPVEVRRAA